jgi:hypothetical protein
MKWDRFPFLVLVTRGYHAHHLPQAEAIELSEGTSLASTFAPPIYLQSFFSNYKLAGV